jgi:acetylornithine deacetylase/succinyl-diaminopimelate desuccinylase-like protein
MRKWAIVALLGAPLSALGADRYPIDWQQAALESREHFRALIELDTSNPPGNETQAAHYLERVLRHAGVETKLFALEPERANLVARIRGNGSKRPILVMGHTDVVGVQREKWSVDPFAAVERDGYIYGRGTLDDKDNVTAGLMLMLLLERAGVVLDRDVILLAEAGEEGTPQVGVDFMVNEHWNDIGAEYCLAEGGGAVARDGKVRYVEIATTEKFAMRARLIAHGTAGHGSIPRVDNAIGILARALSRVTAWQPPMRLNATTRTYFERLATISEPEEAYRYSHLTDHAARPRIERYLAEHEPANYSVLRTSVVPTIVSGGFRRNVIPSEAEATLDIRALPDEDPEAFYEALAGVINDPDVEIVPEPVYRPQTPPSGLDNEMFRALETVTQQLFPGAITLPSMSTGATDKAEVRAKGAQCYGFGPVRDEADMAAGGGSHGDDERIENASLTSLVQFLWLTVLEVAAAK